jgi:hypothetical protein
VLGPGRYLLSTAEILLLATFAWLGASRARARLVPRFVGAPAQLATSVLALALLIWAAELLGSLSLLQPLPYLLLVAAIGLTLRLALPQRQDPPPAGGVAGGTAPEEALATAGGGGSPAATGSAGSAPGPAAGTARPTPILTAIALLIAAVALLHFAWDAKSKLSTGMTGFDSTWYHGPFAAGFFQTGSSWDLHFIAPQFLAWFYPANGEIFHAVGMLAFGRDVLSPLFNVGWFAGCLLACWCIGRPYGVAPWSLALGAVALSVPALADQAGEARNDIVGVFFLLAAVAIALNAWAGRRDEQQAGKEKGDRRTAVGERLGLSTGPLAVVGLAAGLAAGTKLNFLLPAAVLVLGLGLVAPRGRRRHALVALGLGALAGGGYWYLRNLVHSGNPLPWIDNLGPISLPAPDQALGGREAHSVLGYLLDGSVWSNWFLPGLHDGLWFLWPPLLAAALTGLLLSVAPAIPGRRTRRHGPARDTPGTESPLAGHPIVPSTGIGAVAGFVGLAAALAWLVAPTSASGPEGMPRGFESGLRYLVPALVLGLALLPTVPPFRVPLSRLTTTPLRSQFFPVCGKNCDIKRRGRVGLVMGGVAVVAIAVGYLVQRHYLEGRYEDPTFTTPGLNAAFAWTRDVSDARIATTSTRQYPLFGTDLSNHVAFIGEEHPHGGFEPPTTCLRYHQLLNEGHYDYVIASRDRLGPGRHPFPPQARWTEGPWAEVILREPPTVVFRLTGTLEPSACS